MFKHISYLMFWTFSEVNRNSEHDVFKPYVFNGTIVELPEDQK